METEQLIVLGGGGHARVLIATLLLKNRRPIGFVDPDASLPSIYGVERLGSDNVVSRHPPPAIRLINGLGSIGSTAARTQLFLRFRAKGYRFASVIHPSAVMAKDVRIGEGVQVMAGAIIQPGVRLGANCIINTGAIVDHDCQLGKHVHLGPGAVLSGQVKVASGAHIGTGASVIQSVRLGSCCLVAAGAIVIRNVTPHTTVAGVPATVVRTKG